MSDAGILDGDIVLVRQQNTAENGGNRSSHVGQRSHGQTFL